MTPAASPHPTWPTTRFYWAVLETGSTRASIAGVLPAVLLDEFQDAVPVAADDLHIVCATATAGPLAGKLIVCGAMHEELAGAGTGTLSLTPEALPAFLQNAVEPAVLNMLIGAHEPTAMRAERRKLSLITTLAAASICVLTCIGLVRRTAAWEQGAGQAQEARSELLTSASVSAGSTENDPFALAREIDRLRRATEASALPVNPPDAGLALASLLRAWPANVDATPRSISIKPETITMTVELPGEARPFLDAFKAPAGWMLEEPRVSAVRSVTTLNLQLKRAASTRTGGSQ
jgi:hypothetical protein